MNKAFVREPDHDPSCPAPRGCGGHGVPVGRDTLDAQLENGDPRRFSDSVFFCATPGCPVSYFDALGASVGVEELRVPVWPKDREAPICPCFSVTERELVEEAEAGSRELVRSLVKRADSVDARCRACSPTGQPCTVDVRRVFLRHFRPSMR